MTGASQLVGHRSTSTTDGGLPAIANRLNARGVSKRRVADCSLR